jgi:hypothetical protein
MPTIQTQVCTRCAENGDKKPKPLRLFAKSRSGGRRTICTPCVRKQQARIRDIENGNAAVFPDLDWSDISVSYGRHQSARTRRINTARKQYDNAKAYFPKASNDEQTMLAAHAVDLWRFGTDEACEDHWSDIDQITRIGFVIRESVTA